MWVRDSSFLAVSFTPEKTQAFCVPQTSDEQLTFQSYEAQFSICHM